MAEFDFNDLRGQFPRGKTSVRCPASGDAAISQALSVKLPRGCELGKSGVTGLEVADLAAPAASIVSFHELFEPRGRGAGNNRAGRGKISGDSFTYSVGPWVPTYCADDQVSCPIFPYPSATTARRDAMRAKRAQKYPAR